MVVFLFGPDDWRREAKKRAVISEFLAKRPQAGLGPFDGEAENALERFTEFVRNRSIFSAVRLAVIVNPFAMGEGLKKILVPLVHDRELTVLLVSPDRAPSAYAFLKKEPVLQEEFPFLEGPAWIRFVRAEAKRQGITLADDACAELARAYEKDTWRLVTALEKAQGLGKTRLERSDLAALDAETAAEFWPLFTAYRGGRRPERLAALHGFFRRNDPPPKIFNILGAQLKHRAEEFARYDVLIKYGKLGYEEALLDFAL